jgi:hypothetical protein
VRISAEARLGRHQPGHRRKRDAFSAILVARNGGPSIWIFGQCPNPGGGSTLSLLKRSGRVWKRPIVFRPPFTFSGGCGLTRSQTSLAGLSRVARWWGLYGANWMRNALMECLVSGTADWGDAMGKAFDLPQNRSRPCDEERPDQEVDREPVGAFRTLGECAGGRSGRDARRAARRGDWADNACARIVTPKERIGRVTSARPRFVRSSRLGWDAWCRGAFIGRLSGPGRCQWLKNSRLTWDAAATGLCTLRACGCSE